jgi:hypothetical protein
MGVDGDGPSGPRICQERRDVISRKATYNAGDRNKLWERQISMDQHEADTKSRTMRQEGKSSG